MPPEPAAQTVYRFSPWWVNAIAVLPLAGGTAAAYASSPFFGTVVALVVATFLVTACLVAAVLVPVLTRRIPALAASAHPGAALFGVLAAGWAIAWVLGVVVVDAVALLANRVLLSPLGLGGSDTSGPYGPEPGFLAYGAPVLALYVAISGVVAVTFRRRSPGRLTPIRRESRPTEAPHRP